MRIPRVMNMSGITLIRIALALVLAVSKPVFAQSGVVRECTPQKIAEVMEPGSTQKPSVEVNCHLKLNPSSVVTKIITVTGDRANGTSIDCQGSVIKRFNDSFGYNIDIRSEKVPNSEAWSRPENIVVKNCELRSGIRVMGMAPHGQGAILKESSFSQGHTARAQANAPTRIELSNLNIFGSGYTPVYLSPGVTHVTMKDSNIQGWSNGAGVYLDAESAYNVFINNVIKVETRRQGFFAVFREQVAIDGSAHNRFERNQILDLKHGGIYLYRNCGEGGTVRHQPPINNLIMNNVFTFTNFRPANPAVHIASRNALSLISIYMKVKHCHEEDGYEFGSSTTNRDLAENNFIIYNTFVKASPEEKIKTTTVLPNIIAKNVRVDEPTPAGTWLKPENMGCYVANGDPVFVGHGGAVSRFKVNGVVQCTGEKLVCNAGNWAREQVLCN